jgi:hypothetical protein
MLLSCPFVRFAAGAALALLAACGSGETQAADDHTPVSFTVLVDDVPVSSPYTLPSGRTVRVRLKFLNAGGEDLDEVEGSHFAGLTFSPTSLASAVRVTDRNFQFDVTGGTPGEGTVQVGYGHDAEADEHTFPAAPITVTETP